MKNVSVLQRFLMVVAIGSYGSKTKPGWARRTASPDAGPGAALDRPRQRTSAPHRPTCSAPSARPRAGKGAALVLPRCNTEAMGLHLAEISAMTDPDAHAVVLLDQAGWRTARALAVPENITLMPLPSHAPELNPVENIWQFMRDNWLSNRVFASYEDIVDHCCTAWNRLVHQPWTIMSIDLRDWAHQF